jgi:hypothetical protein
MILTHNHQSTINAKLSISGMYSISNRLATVQIYCTMTTVNMSLTTPWRHIGGTEVQLHSFLTSALDGGEWSTSRSGRFTPGKETRYLLNRRLGGSQRRSGRFWRKLGLCWDLNPGPHSLPSLTGLCNGRQGSENWSGSTITNTTRNITMKGHTPR